MTIVKARDSITGNMNVFQQLTSFAAHPVDDTVEMDVVFGNTHVFIGIQMFDSSGDPVIPTDGTFEVSAKTLNSDRFEPIPSSIVRANNPETVSVAGNISQIRVVPVGVIGNDITTWVVIVTCNRS